MTGRERTKRRAPALSDSGEARLQVSIARDPDTAELTDLELANLRPAHEVPPPDPDAVLTARDGLRAETKRVPPTLRGDPDVLVAYRAGGPGREARRETALAKEGPRGPVQAKTAKRD